MGQCCPTLSVEAVASTRYSVNDEISDLLKQTFPLLALNRGLCSHNKISNHMLFVAHPDEGGGNPWSRARKLNGAFCVIRCSQLASNYFRQALCESSLIKRCAADDGDPSSFRGFKDREHLFVEGLVLQGSGLWHGQVEGQLNKTKVVSIAAHLTRHGYNVLQADGFPLRVGQTEGIPGSAPVKAYLVGLYHFFQRGECLAPAMPEICRAHACS